MKITDLNNCVLDTSVVIKWFSQENEFDCEQANSLVVAIKKEELKLFVPDLLLYELGNALLKGKKFTYSQIESAWDYFHSLKIEIFSANLTLLNKAVRTALEYNLTVYDATFIALAEIQRCPLITANPKCFSKVKESFVINLSDLEMD